MESFMTFLQMACALLVSLLWGLQFVVVKLGLMALPLPWSPPKEFATDVSGSVSDCVHWLPEERPGEREDAVLNRLAG